MVPASMICGSAADGSVAPAARYLVAAGRAALPLRHAAASRRGCGAMLGPPLTSFAAHQPAGALSSLAPRHRSSAFRSLAPCRAGVASHAPGRRALRRRRRPALCVLGHRGPLPAPPMRPLCSRPMVRPARRTVRLDRRALKREVVGQAAFAHQRTKTIRRSCFRSQRLRRWSIVVGGHGSRGNPANDSRSAGQQRCR